jgi:hypothetical protein
LQSEFFFRMHPVTFCFCRVKESGKRERKRRLII